MGLVLGHREGEGANIGASIYTRVGSIVVDNYITLYVERRDYENKGEQKPWSAKRGRFTLRAGDGITYRNTDILSEGEGIKFYRFGYKSASDKWIAMMWYTMPSNMGISKVFWVRVRDPWRRAFAGDGIEPSCFGGNVNELFVERLRNGTELAYSLVSYDDAEEMAYLCIRQEGYRIIARVFDGRIVQPDYKNRSSLDYIEGMNEAKDCIIALAKRLDVAHAFKNVPTVYKKYRLLKKRLKDIIESRERYAECCIVNSELEELILKEQI